MAYRKYLFVMLVMLGVALAIRPSMAVTPYDDVLVQQGIKNLQQENYDEAVADLTQAWEKGTRNAEKAFLLGQAYRFLLDYPKAKEYLEEAVRQRPDFNEALLMLADTLLAMEKPQEALPHLQKVEATGFEPGQTAFLLGMVATKKGRYSEAVDYFNKAQQDPKVAQEAKFQASLALAAQNRLKEARTALEESIALGPLTATADFASRYKGVLDKRITELRPFRFSVGAGFDFDSNVTLQPGDPTAAAQVSGKGDAVFSQYANFEYTLRPEGPFSVLGQYAYFQNFHPRLSTFDVMSHSVALIPFYTFKSGRLWMPLGFNYSDVQSDKYYTGYLFNPTYLHLFTEKWGVEVSARYNRKYYWFPVSFTQDDRSAKNVGGTMGLYYFFKKQKGFLQARFGYEHDFTLGSNWDADTYRLLLAGLYPITDKWKVQVSADLFLQPYDRVYFNGATFGNIAGAPLLPQPKRFDKVGIFGIQTTYEFYKGLEFNVHYFFIRDNSNIALYDYTRHIVGCQLGYRY